MNTLKLFGIEWNNENLDTDHLSINVLSNQCFGKFALSLTCLELFADFPQQENYKALALIREKTIFNKPYFICKKDQLIDMANLIPNNATVSTIENFLIDFPSTIVDLQQRTLMLLYKQFSNYGQLIDVMNLYDFFSRNKDEHLYFLKNMIKKEWFDGGDVQEFLGGGFIPSTLVISETGWIEIEKSIDNKYSKQVFVAMWFDPVMDKAFAIIEKAIVECGFTVIRIDRKQYNNEISGEILFEIQKCKFLIADVTNQRNGVYFEAGFAMGGKKPVIWMCKEDDLKNVHFDTRQYNHIVWKDENDLYQKLKDRILGTIVVQAS